MMFTRLHQMRITCVLVIALIFCADSLSGQIGSRINKYSIGIEIDAGHSFPNFKTTQNRWKGSFYPAGALSISLRNRINRNWQTDVGIGITGYALINNGPYDNYILDFASPHLTTGIQYIKFKGRTKEKIIRLKSGMQLGYTKEFTETFSDYNVKVIGRDPVYFFLRPEIGIRNNFKNRINGFRLAYELGVFYRYTLNGLGSAQFSEKDHVTIVQPKGDIIGFYFNVVFPAGKQKMKIENKKDKSNEQADGRPSF